MFCSNCGNQKTYSFFIFTTLTFFVGLLQEGCCKVEGLVGYRYQWGIGHTLLHIGAILAIGGIFYMIVRKKRVRA